MPITKEDFNNAFTVDLKEIIHNEMIAGNDGLEYEEHILDNIEYLRGLNEKFLFENYAQEKVQIFVDFLNELEKNGKELYFLSSTEIIEGVDSWLNSDDYCAVLAVFDPKLKDKEILSRNEQLNYLQQKPATAMSMLQNFVYAQVCFKNICFDDNTLFISDEFGTLVEKLLELSKKSNKISLVRPSDEEGYDWSTYRYFIQEENYVPTQAINAINFLNSMFTSGGYSLNWKAEMESTKIVKSVLQKIENCLLDPKFENDVRNQMSYLMYTVDTASICMSPLLKDLSQKVGSKFFVEMMKILNSNLTDFTSDALLFHYAYEETLALGNTPFSYSFREEADKYVLSINSNTKLLCCHEYFKREGKSLGKNTFIKSWHDEKGAFSFESNPYAISFNKKYFNNLNGEKAIDLLVETLYILKKEEELNEEMNPKYELLNLLASKYREEYLLENINKNKNKINKKKL